VREQLPQGAEAAEEAIQTMEAEVAQSPQAPPPLSWPPTPPAAPPAAKDQAGEGGDVTLAQDASAVPPEEVRAPFLSSHAQGSLGG
jgi:hypothetical protein